ncbi:MAG TPA: leucyl/phenylalanyl-tRNA--protein transferase [Gammaproteobacteria bacterium]|nr:leucyl/phenylalanyl-tRNA--protein transferase [Gammaproteobacteria bacterium]
METDPTTGRRPFWIEPHDHSLAFPDVELALREPDGLLAVGGDLSPQRIFNAYRHGIFPWYSDGQPILWWSPDPRSVLLPERLKISRSLRKTLRRGRFRVTLDKAFEAVIAACAAPRRDSDGTWITAEMAQAYRRLHHLGVAHSAECWNGERLVGGLYGLAIGRVFFGESMFSRESDASKTAFAFLVRQLRAWGFRLIDCQVHSPHLASLGAEQLARAEFVARLEDLCAQAPDVHDWRRDADTLDHGWDGASP